MNELSNGMLLPKCKILRRCLSGINGVYCGLKSSIFVEVDELWITGSKK
jgi:hypothetical protein